MAYVRKTSDEWQIHGMYDGEWEEVTCANNSVEGRELLKEYRDNEPETRFKLLRKRVPIEPEGMAGCTIRHDREFVPFDPAYLPWLPRPQNETTN